MRIEMASTSLIADGAEVAGSAVGTGVITETVETKAVVVAVVEDSTSIVTTLDGDKVTGTTALDGDEVVAVASTYSSPPVGEKEGKNVGSEVASSSLFADDGDSEITWILTSCSEVGLMVGLKLGIAVEGDDEIDSPRSRCAGFSGSGPFGAETVPPMSVGLEVLDMISDTRGAPSFSAFLRFSFGCSACGAP